MRMFSLWAVLAGLVLLSSACTSGGTVDEGRLPGDDSPNRVELGIGEESGVGAVPVEVTSSYRGVDRGPGYPGVADPPLDGMLTTALDRGLIDAADAEAFRRVQAALDAPGETVRQGGARPGEDIGTATLGSLLDAAVAAGRLSQEDADAYARIHDVLVDYGLMPD